MQLTVVLVAVLVGVASARPQLLDASQFSGGGGGGQPVARFQTTTTPRPLVPIIRHINRVNNDGSYTFGYESGDGSYRVETKGLDGVIKGKYGYVDEQGIRKEVDYIAGSDVGYEPRGQGITVPPRPPPRPPGQEFLDYDDGSGTTPRPRTRVQQAPVQQFVAQPAPRPRPQPVAQAQPVFHQPQPQFVAAPPPPPPAPQVSFQAVPVATQVVRQAQPVARLQQAPVRSSSGGGPSPIEQFLRQQLSGPPQPQPF